MPGSPHTYRQEGQRRGIPEEHIDRSLQQMAVSDARGVGAVLSLGHLAFRSRTSYPVLRRIVERSVDPYRSFTLRRRDGRKMRPIAVPEPTLMQAQRWILDHILAEIPVHARSFAYQRGSDVKSCAGEHLGARWLVKLDIHDFFTSVDEVMVYTVFSACGYAPLVAFELARLCTRDPARATHIDRERYERFGLPDKWRGIPDYSTHWIGFLPQGAPSSGALANLVMTPLDEHLHRLASEMGFTYTRYSDDLTFSASTSFDRRAARKLMVSVRRTLEGQRFELHKQKSRIVPPGARKIVLGLLVDGDHLRLPRERKAQIRAHLRGVERFGLADHTTHRGFASMAGLVNHVEGLLSYAVQVEPDWAAPFREEWRSLAGPLALGGGTQSGGV